jgi:hypothetical protein
MKPYKKMSLEEFKEWKEGFLKDKGCPFFCCKRSLVDKDCGSKRICGVLTNYVNIDDDWQEECTLDLTSKDPTPFLYPTPNCITCTGTSAFYETDKIHCKSICFLINDRAEQSNIPVDRSFEKYLPTFGAFIVPLFGEETYLSINSTVDLKLTEKIEKMRMERK